MNKNLFKDLTFEIINLFLKNKNEFLHGRDIARELNKNQKTVQDHLNLLEKEKILTVIEKGRNYNFKLYFSNSITFDLIITSKIFNLIKFKEKSFEIKSILDDLKFLTNSPIIIFGSYAKSYETKESDLDILILNSKKIDLSNIQKKYNLKLHIIFQSREEFQENLFKDNPFQLDIIQNNIILQEFEYLCKLWLNKYEKN